MERYLKIHSGDNVAVALTDLNENDRFEIDGNDVQLVQDIPVKHKFTLNAMNEGDTICMYGVPVGKLTTGLPAGSMLTVENTRHVAAPYHIGKQEYRYQPPEVDNYTDRTFQGYHRKDGQVGTANYWLFIPLVFCQNRNLKVLQEALETELGFRRENPYKLQVRELAGKFQGRTQEGTNTVEKNKVFPNVDGIKFLIHEGGCGGTRQDTQLLVNLLAGYIRHPNVAGATVLSLGCQHAQIAMLEEALGQTGEELGKPLLFFEQQQYSSEHTMLNEIIHDTFEGLRKANNCRRTSAPLSKLTLGLECGGSDGFSGISANPLIGVVADRINALKGKSILSEFPELCGVEQDLIDRCTTRETAGKFVRLMRNYETRAQEVGSGFDMNPSPGNIRDGLITDAIKSAGAATKGGRSPISDVLDYGEYATRKGLNLLCTPGNDVESTTGLAGAGANIILFSTGLGTPTGNPVCPVVKISSNSMLPEKINDIIDFDAGRLFSESKSQKELADELMELIIAVASGEKQTCAQKLQQDDFIPWKRGISL
ncbi:UxaA family hydrolase [Sinomicrobium weinanense]|uniref:Altronate dehydratase n=1 Tax=Sinomicrobium weinanense TaxID=2842200 RepID=A0A926JT13_9FLAO|nr:altronate dehydratase family protein [Sinomicrobium weinanense]MBC9796722.1 altronate dehydratase [Sinomicrobium weinanense]MBU3123003.1 altronate dehydratase family protein [Sinomicrobium weinanense]